MFSSVSEATGSAARLLLAALGVALAATGSWAQTFPDKIGVELDSPYEGARGRPFVDLGKVFRPFTVVNGSAAAPTDSDGWPLSDAQAVLFDIRPIAAWANEIDDPAKFQPDWSGTWKLSLEGQAEIASQDAAAVRVTNARYDAARNVTVADVEVAPGAGLVLLTFRNTRRTPQSVLGSGFRKLRFLRPGYSEQAPPIFTNEYLRSLGPFRVLRYMDFTSTNNSDPKFDDPLRDKRWEDRHLLTDATQQDTGRKIGTAWEYAILLANMTGTDMWINIPVSANDDYVRQLSRLLKQTLTPGLKVYIEHSNEVWNPLFGQYEWNRRMAIAEVNAGGSRLNSGGVTDQAVWAQRRHARRLLEYASIFKEAWGEAAINDSIRFVYSWWTANAGQYQPVLSWLRENFGDPGRNFYALAQTSYFNARRAPANASVAELLEFMRASSNEGSFVTQQLGLVARQFGLRHFVYEGGPDNGGGSTINVANRILANRDAGMKDLILHDIRTNWFPKGGDLYMYFAHSGAYSRYGCWGLTEDIVNQNTFKYQAIRELVGPASPVDIRENGIVNAASNAPTMTAGSYISIYGDNLAEREYIWDNAIPDGVTLPNMLGGLQVRVNGKDTFVSYAGKNQANILLPPDLGEGMVDVEIYARGAITQKKITLRKAAPAFFGYPLDGRRYVAALFANSAVYVAPEGKLPGVSSRAAKAGDYLQLYANGLGRTTPQWTAGKVLDTVYPVADLSKVKVTIAGKPVPVLFAGMTQAGLFQINVQVVEGLGAGDLAVVVEVDGESSSADIFLPFQ